MRKYSFKYFLRRFLLPPVVPFNAIKLILKTLLRQMQQIPMTSPPAVGYPAADPQWLHRQQQISRMAHQVHHAHQERAATPWPMNPYALNQSKFLNTKRSPCNQIILVVHYASSPEKIRQLIQRQEYNAIVEQKAFASGQSNTYR